ncbi:MAG: hypothetical protein PHZ14_10225 [Sulfuricella sp.]|jgi:hypothetical protein|nr:hypothetical protein [Sulfuricella sp.]
MKTNLKPLIAAILVAGAQLSGTAFAQAAKTPPAINADWAIFVDQYEPVVDTHETQSGGIIFADEYTPVVDAVSSHLETALKAFDAKDNVKAAAGLRAVASELRAQAAHAGAMADGTPVERTILQRLDTAASKVNAAAAGIENGKIKTRADLVKVIDKAARADMDNRWLVSGISTWYAVTGKPQWHFDNAAADYAKKDYRAAATEIRKAVGYLRLESVRATGDTRQALNSSVAELDKLAVSMKNGTLKDEKLMDQGFARASHALALAHRAEAAESWSGKAYNKVGYELKAAAHDLESAAGWTGAEAKAGASRVVADTQALGDRLASGATWTRDEVGRGFDALGHALNELGQKIGARQQAVPLKAGS